MKPTLKVGITGQLTTQVGSGNTITLGSDRRASVFSTPSMINLMEHAAREALRPHLDDGEESVGVDVQITHSSATPPRTEVTAQATATDLQKNVITFDVVARDSWGEIGRGTHRRAVIETTRFVEHLAKHKPLGDRTESGASLSVSELKTLSCHQTGELLRVTLNRPQKRNAVSAEMTREFEQLMAWLDQNRSTVRVVIVDGSNHTFCAGDDVGDLPAEATASRELSLRRGSVYRTITELPQIFIASIEGLALGGGLVLASACDYRIATHGAKLGLPEVSLGWLPNYGLEIIGSLVGRGKLLELALAGSPIEARRAESIGLVGRVVPAAQLDAEVNRLAEHLVSMPAEALAATKRVLTPGGDWSDARATEAFLECIATETARKNMARFKR